jgi:D-sedoheptulose 7-phosphate isomerase
MKLKYKLKSDASKLETQIEKSVLPENAFHAFFTNYTNNINRIFNLIDISTVEALMHAIIAARLRNSQIILMGNGGSAAIASHLAADLAKQKFEGDEFLFRVMSLGDNLPWFSATANDFGYDNVFAQQLKVILQPDDVVVAISSSGNSKNVLNAISYANKKGAKTFGIVGFDGGKLLHIAQQSIYIPTKIGQYELMEDVAGIVSHMISNYVFEQDCKVVPILSHP